MNILRIEHPVRDFGAWQRAFEQDPVGRRQGGVRRYRVCRSHDDPAYVMVDLEFDSLPSAEAFRERLRALWREVEGNVIQSPTVTLMDVVDAAEC